MTVKSGTAPCRFAATTRRRTFLRKCGRVKRPSHIAFGSRAIFQTSAAFRRCPERRYARHWCHEGAS